MGFSQWGNLEVVVSADRLRFKVLEPADRGLSLQTKKRQRVEITRRERGHGSQNKAALEVSLTRSDYGPKLDRWTT